MLGTASYMAPEQAKGKPVDRRADIWAFGCVLYELLTGRRAFDGEDVPDILGAIIKSEPDWTKLPAATPARVRTLLARCLAKDRTQRLQHTRDARLELTTPWENPPEPVTAHLRASRLGWVVAGIATTAAAVLAALVLREQPTAMPRAARFHIPLADDQQFTNVGRHVLAFSPDGSRLVFVANTRLYLRNLATDKVEVIQGSESRAGVLEPVFSPDGEWVAYYSNDDRAIKRIRISGGGSQSICATTPPFGMSWGEAGLLFGDGNSGILRVNPDGGSPEVVVAVAAPQVAASPHAMLGGKWIAFSLAEGSSVGRWERGVIAMQSLSTGERRTLVSSATDSRAAGGHLFYRSGATLYAVALAPDGLGTRGTPTAVVEGIRGPSAGGVNPPTGQYATSSSGALAFIRGGVSVTADRHLAIVDVKGTVRRLGVPPNSYTAPRISPDGRFVAVAAEANRETAIWICELAGTRPPRRLTFDGENRFPLWSADGLWVYFASAHGDERGLFRQRSDGSAAAQLLAQIDEFVMPEAAHPDGSLILFSQGTTGGFWKLGSIQTRDGTIRHFDHITSSSPLQASLSQDGQWLAYVVGNRGTYTTYVEPFPPTGVKYEVPHRGEAAHPVWLPTGRSLMFQDYADLWQVDVETTPSFRFGPARALQRGGAMTGTASTRRNLDVISGTDSFIAVVPPEGQGVSPIATERQIDVVLNWQTSLAPGGPAQ